VPAKSLADEVGSGLTGLDQLRALMASGRRPGILDALRFDFVEVEPGRAVFVGTPGVHAYNPIGVVHGSWAAALLDSACGCAVHSKLTATQGYTTLELKVSFLRPLTDETGLVRAEGRAISVGRRAAFAEGVLTGADGRPYATASSTLLVFDRSTSSRSAA
jgi:uncharacterized protein (TIGR00369 family)